MTFGNLAIFLKGSIQAPTKVNTKAFNPNKAPLIRSNRSPIPKPKSSPLKEPLEIEKMIVSKSIKSGYTVPRANTWLDCIANNKTVSNE